MSNRILKALFSFCLALICLSLVEKIISPAAAGSYSGQVQNSGVQTAGTPFALCGMICEAVSGVYDPYCSGYGGAAIAPKCGVRRRSNGTMELYIRALSGSWISDDITVTVNSGGDSCIQSWFTGLGLGAGPYDNAGACAMCPAPQEWDAATQSCVEPSCDVGEVYDEEIAACRAECTDPDEFFHYGELSCKKTCPAGLAGSEAFVTNKVFEIDADSTVNGCPVVVRFVEIPDLDYGGGTYYHGANWTGKMYYNWFEYQAYPVDFSVISQSQYEAETGSPGYYEGEVGAAAIRSVPNLLDIEIVEFDLGHDVPIDIADVHFLCLGGQYRVVQTINGVVDDVEFLGACGAEGEVSTVNPGSADQVNIARVEQKVDAVKVDTAESKTILDEISDAVGTMGEALEEIRVALMGEVGGGDPGEGGACEGEGCAPLDPGEFPTEADPEAMYTREYSEGAEGVGEALAGASALSPTGEIQSFFSDLQPIWPTSVPACLAWDIEVIFLGEIHFEPPCWLWDMLKAFLLLAAVVMAWGLMFGSNRSAA